MKMLKLVNNSQKGFTMIEVVIAIAITAIITGAIIMTIFHVFDGNIRSSNHMIAVKQVENAGHWISHDTLMAQSVTPDLGATGFPLTLTWTEYGVDGDEYQVDYTLEDMTGSTLKNLQRVYSVDGTPTETGYVAQYIDTDPTKTKCEFASGVFTLTITATVGAQIETRTYEIIPRPGS